VLRSLSLKGGWRSGDKENFSRIRIFHLLTRAVAADVHVAAAGVEWTENVSWLSRHRLRGGIFGLSCDSARSARRWLRFFRHGSRRRTRRGAGSDIAALGVAARRRPSDRSAWRRHRVGRRCRRGGGGRLLLLSVNLAANKICRRIEHSERGVRDLTCGGAAAQNDCGQQKDPRSGFHVRTVSSHPLLRQRNPSSSG
jgi:hypothetical protein